MACFINYNGELKEEKAVFFSVDLLLEGALCEKINIKKGKILFWEDHYFFLMASMRILRMEIPMNYSPSYLQRQLEILIEKNQIQDGLIDFSCFDFEKKIHFLLRANKLDSPIFYLQNPHYELDFYKDFRFISNSLLSSLPFAYVNEKKLALTYAKENELDELILMNDQNRITQGMNAYLFLVKSDELITPKLEEGLRKNIIQKKFIEFLIATQNEFKLKEIEISPFEIQRADEFFFLENLSLRPIEKFRKTSYKTSISQKIFQNWKNYLDQISSND